MTCHAEALQETVVALVGGLALHPHPHTPLPLSQCVLLSLSLSLFCYLSLAPLPTPSIYNRPMLPFTWALGAILSLPASFHKETCPW
jgi:hypothetical protein